MEENEEIMEEIVEENEGGIMEENVENEGIEEENCVDGIGVIHCSSSSAITITYILIIL